MRSILVAGALVMGCGSKPTAVETTDAAVEASQGEPIVVGEADAGKSIDLIVGQELVVRLAGNPSTGYSWAAVPVDAPVLAAGVAVFESDPAPDGMVGVGGTEVLRFKASQAGTQTLTLRYARPWETDVAPAMEIAYTVTVK